MSSRDDNETGDAGADAPTSSPWGRLFASIGVGLAAGVLVSVLVPSVLSVLEWPRLVSPEWVERLDDRPTPSPGPTPQVEPSIVQPVETQEPAPTPGASELEDDDPRPEPPSMAPEPAEPRETRPPDDSDSSQPRPEQLDPAMDEPDTPDAPVDVTYKVDRRAIAKMIRTPVDLGEHGRFVPNIVDGQRRGFRFEHVAAGGLFDRLGVRKDDIVLEVNGRELTTQSKLLEDLKSLEKARVYVVHIERGSARRIHRYDAGPPLEKSPQDVSTSNNGKDSR